VPEAAIRWYEQALKIPNLEGESAMALHYELGAAYEAAQNKPVALKHFLQVYGSNIDYRDVAERIKASGRKMSGCVCIGKFLGTVPLIAGIGSTR